MTLIIQIHFGQFPANNWIVVLVSSIFASDIRQSTSQDKICFVFRKNLSNKRAKQFKFQKKLSNPYTTYVSLQKELGLYEVAREAFHGQPSRNNNPIVTTKDHSQHYYYSYFREHLQPNGLPLRGWCFDHLLKPPIFFSPFPFIKY